MGGTTNRTQPSRGRLHRLQKVVNVPHHCLVTVSVAMHTGQLGLRIQGVPLLDHHHLTRHTSYVCGGEALGEFIATVAVGQLPKKTLVENR